MADFQGYIQLFLIGLATTILVRGILIRTKDYTARRPPSPLAFPIIGHLHLISPIPHRDFYNLSILYGPIMHLFLCSLPCVVASTAESAKHFLKTHEMSFCSRLVQTVAVESLTYGFKDFLFAPYGTLCRILDQYLLLRQQETGRFLRIMLEKAEENEAVSIGRELMRLSNNIISRMTLSKMSSGNDNEAEEIEKLVVDTAELTGKFNISDFIWLYKKLDLQGFDKRPIGIRESFDTMLDRFIREHEEERKKRKEMGGEGQVKDILYVL